jgi:Fe-S-cluster containining protein
MPKKAQSTTGTIRLLVRGRPVEMTLTVPVDPVPPQEMLPVVRQMTHAIIDAMVGQVVEQGETVSCKAGCVACCHQLIPVAPVEAHRLAELVTAMPEARQAEIRGRFDEVKLRLAEAGLLDPLLDPALRGDRSLREIGLAYMQQVIPCPFLDGGSSCAIYQERPLSCREYLVTSPAENCWRPSAETVRQVPMPARVSNALIRIGGDAAPEASAFVPLVLALDWVGRHPEGPAAITGPAMVKQIMENVSGKTIA